MEVITHNQVELLLHLTNFPILSDSPPALNEDVSFSYLCNSMPFSHAMEL